MGRVNQAFPSDKFDALLERVLTHMRERDLFVQDLYCGAHPKYRLPIRVIAEYAWHACLCGSFLCGRGQRLGHTRTGVHRHRSAGVEAVPDRDGTRTSTLFWRFHAPHCADAAQNTPAR